MKNENPQVAAAPVVNDEEGRRNWNAQRLEDRMAAAEAGKGFLIVVKGKCKVCKRRSAAVPATQTQAMAWFTEQLTTGFTKYQIEMLTTGVHRACQKVAKEKAKAKAHRRVNNDVHAVPMDGEKMARVIARRQRQRA